MLELLGDPWGVRVRITRKTGGLLRNLLGGCYPQARQRRDVLRWIGAFEVTCDVASALPLVQHVWVVAMHGGGCVATFCVVWLLIEGFDVAQAED